MILVREYRYPYLWYSQDEFGAERLKKCSAPIVVESLMNSVFPGDFIACIQHVRNAGDLCGFAVT